MSEKSTTSKSTMTKIIFGLFLIAALYGFVIADIQSYFPAIGSPTIRTVNGNTISQAELIQERNGLRQQMNMGYQDPLIQQQLIYRALDNLTTRAAILSYAESLNIRASNQDIADILKAIPAFQDMNGEFDKFKFKKILNDQRISVGTFKNNLAQGIVQGKLTTPITADFPLTATLADIINQLAFTEITLDSYNFAFKDLPAVYQTTVNPTDEQLEQLYEEKKESLIRPELKNIDYVLFDASSIKDKVTVADKAIQAYYDNHQKDLYFTPKKWKLFQIIFDTKEAADKGYKKLTQSTDFQKSAQKMGYQLDDIDLGYITPQELTVTDNTDLVFSHKIKQITQPIETDFGYAIYYIEDIKPETTIPFDNVKQDIYAKLLDQKLTNYLTDISLKIEDDLAGGAEFTEITQNYGSEIISIKNITPDGNIYGSDDAQETVPNIIPMEYITDYTVGDEIPMIQLDNEEFALIKITASEPAKGLTFEEAKQDLIDQDIKEQQNAILTQIVNQLITSDNPEKFVQQYQLTPKEYRLTRNAYIPNKIYRQGFDGIIYAQKEGESFKDITDQKALLVIVKKITPPSEINTTETEDFTAKLQIGFSRQIQEKALDMLIDNAEIETDDEALAALMQREIKG